MGCPFRKTLRIIPGLWLNLSPQDGSLSVCGPGATVKYLQKPHLAPRHSLIDKGITHSRNYLKTSDFLFE